MLQVWGALANDARVVWVDEPTGALDAKNGAAVFAVFRVLADDGRTVIVVTHGEQSARNTERASDIVDGRVAHSPSARRRQREAARQQSL